MIHLGYQNSGPNLDKGMAITANDFARKGMRDTDVAGSPVDAGGGEVLLREEGGQEVSVALGLHKHQSPVSTWESGHSV